MLSRLITIFFLILQFVFGYFGNHSIEDTAERESKESNLTQNLQARLPLEIQIESQTESPSDQPHLKIEPEISTPRQISYDQKVELTAQSALVLDRKSKTILFEKNFLKPHVPASLVKLMTALIALESNKDLNQEVLISRAATKVEPFKIKLLWGEKIKAKDLLYATLLASANDAAYSLAEYVAGDVGKFVEKMNKKAKELRLYSTSFINPTGLEENSQYNFSSAYDLALLFDYVLDNETIKNILITKEYTINSQNTNRTYHFKNSNKLLDDENLKILGGKTGFTDKAGWCLIEAAENNGNQIIVVILGSKSDDLRFKEAKELIQWTFKNYTWR